MNIGRYLPSAQFTLIVVSLALSGGLVFAAQIITHPNQQPAVITSTADNTGAVSDSNWEATLDTIQAQNASSSPIAAPSASSVSDLLASAESSNVTDTIGKTLLINLTNAKTQGLGDDIPTQDQIIAQAQAQVSSQSSATVYTLADLNVVPDSATALHAYGNAFMQAFNDHPAANEQNTFAIIGNVSDPGQLQQLTPIKAGYAALTAELLAMPVPETLAPFHLTVVNDFARITASYDQMEVMLTDPLQGIVGFQAYQSSLDEAGRMFTNIAQALSKDGIIFTNGESGSAWSAFASP